MKKLTHEQIHEALENGTIEVTFRCDYSPSASVDKAAYQEIEFVERAWRHLLLAATGRAKMSRQLGETQDVLDWKRRRLHVRALRVRVLTFEAALRLQGAGYELECSRSASLSMT